MRSCAVPAKHHIAAEANSMLEMAGSRGVFSACSSHNTGIIVVEICSSRSGASSLVCLLPLQDVAACNVLTGKKTLLI